MQLIYHPETERELAEAARFYERKVQGLGTQFLGEFEHAVAKILEAPTQWRVLEKNVHRYLMQRFPYVILYRVIADKVQILVVKHQARHPDYGKKRLQSPE